MYCLNFDYKTAQGYRGLILHHLPVKNRAGKIDYKWILGIAADFECKDELKEFCKQRGGGWDFVNKFWYFPLVEVPINPSNWKQETFTAIWEACKSVIDEFSDYIRIAGRHNLAIEAAISIEAELRIQEELKEQVALDNRANIKLVQGEMPTLFNIKWVSDVDEENAHEYRGDEGHFEGDAHLPNGAIQRVEVCEEKPKDFESQNNDPIMGEHVGYRQFLADDGKRYWCRPLIWVDFAIWGDAKLTSTEEASKPVEKAKDVITSAPKLTLPEPIENPDCKIAVALSKDREPLFFTVEFDKDLGYMFGWLVAAVKQIDGRKWNASKKRWEVPIESGQELKKELIEYYGDSTKSSSKATFSLSNKARELLYPQGIPVFLEENVK